jgi:acetolactate decarboxylase
MPALKTEISQSLIDALTAHCKATGEPLRHVVSRALADALGLDHATLFQVSTGSALVKGIHDKATTVGDLRSHGDFGLGTFEGLDGEMMMLDSRVYQAHPDGRISEAPDDAPVPYAAVTHFSPSHRAPLAGIASMEDLTARLDRLRRSPNLFFAIRLEGTFSELHLRVACKVPPGTPLVEAARRQAEFHLSNQTGTIVGFWSPGYTRMVAVPGWHLHFLAADRATGGHVLDCKADRVDAELQDLDELRLAMPETREFLQADFSQDPSAALEAAEGRKPVPPGF